jgi:hypothetical protein
MPPGRAPATKQMRIIRRLALSATVLALLHAGHAASAHPILMTYIQHHASATVGVTNVDIRLELTFFEVRSTTERRRMDADHNGAITASEIRNYLAGIAPSLESGVHLSVGGRRVDLVPLYDPEINLLGVNEVAPSHHLLRLFYFARTPEWLKPGDEIAIEDNLWPHAAAICSFEANGQQGFRIAPRQDSGAASTSEAASAPHVMRAQCLTVPREGRAVPATNPAGQLRASTPAAAAPRQDPCVTSPTAIVLMALGGAWVLMMTIQRFRRKHGPTE